MILSLIAETLALVRRLWLFWLGGRTIACVWLLALTQLLSACGSTPKKPEPTKPTITKSGGYYLDDGPGTNPPPNLDAIPDAIPKAEPLHRGANRPYQVFGKTYVPNVSSDAFRQQGIGSWYGRKFHGNPTSIGEPYDMYGMTAAHPTLPLPSYVRVTNPANAKSVVVRVNDRGPFHSDRIIDLSYVAAAKLGYAQKGSAMVIVERVFPGQVMSPPPPTTSARVPDPTPMTETSPISASLTTTADGIYLQLAAFTSAENAEAFRTRMTRELDWNREPIRVHKTDQWFRVRMGPYATREEADAIAAEVRRTHDLSPVIQKP